MASHGHKLAGGLNGIDTHAWDPSSDPLIAHNYSAWPGSSSSGGDSSGGESGLAAMAHVAEGKAANKAHLRAMLGMAADGADAGKPLIACITRLVPQKGVHLIRHAALTAHHMGAQLVLLGNSPVPEIQRDFEALAAQQASNPNVRLLLRYDERLSHLLYAAADLLLIPSVFEPCGLTQLIAMRYGAIPIVRKTGGLADSVFDVDDAEVPEDMRNGFSFTRPDINAMSHAMERAVNSYYERNDWWKALVLRAMRMDFGWDQSSEQYEKLYHNACCPA
eukprot:TRINITY_DN9247_c0_g1_i1.p1 TRINITY_DN9247_c0_g1~~TRINITY_DN9247_c0_g1_i1.p1  ORF type:complete len:287 (+),score=15.66 TRINITY_DN9247_c0_g1_i1:31-861(+)